MRIAILAAVAVALTAGNCLAQDRGEPATERFDNSRYDYSGRDMRRAEGMLADEASYAGLDPKTQYLIAQKLADKLRRARASRKKWKVIKSGRKWTLQRSKSKVSGIKIKNLEVADKGLEDIHRLNPGLKDVVVEREWASEAQAKPPIMESKEVESAPLRNLFADNDWEVLPDSESGQALIELIEEIVEEMGPKGMVTGMTIRSSASKLPNTGKAKDLSFLQLSEKRAQAARDFIIAYLKEKYGIDVPADKAVLLAKGANDDGTSGPAYPASGMEREDYDKFKYVQVDMDAVAMVEEPGEDGESDMSAQVVTAQVSSRTKRAKVSLPRIKLRRKFQWPNKGRRKRSFKKIPCPAYD